MIDQEDVESMRHVYNIDSFALFLHFLQLFTDVFFEAVKTAWSIVVWNISKWFL